jgi:hypothetical protein
MVYLAVKSSALVRLWHPGSEPLEGSEPGLPTAILSRSRKYNSRLRNKGLSVKIILQSIKQD